MRTIKFRAKPINLSFKYDDGEQGNVEWVYGYYTQKTTYVEPFGLGKCTVEHFINVNCMKQSSEFEWYVTDFCKQCDVEDDYHNVFDNDNVHIYPETVGQFTGLLDKNGKEIYEGDILSNSRQFSEIVFDEEKAAFKVKIIGGSKGWIKGSVIDIHLFQSDYDINIIGNIHDNPELLKKEEK